jgi:hypothetical protein
MSAHKKDRMMGWANCGEDSKGRPIGYAHAATCDHPGCTAEIDRGLSYACGGMHGESSAQGVHSGCEGYFCAEHLRSAWAPDANDVVPGAADQYCDECATAIERNFGGELMELYRSTKKGPVNG